MSDSESRESFGDMEPVSGTDLDDEQLLARDNAELEMTDELTIDSEAEIEARLNPLKPSQRASAEAELAVRDALLQLRAGPAAAARLQEALDQQVFHADRSDSLVTGTSDGRDYDLISPNHSLMTSGDHSTFNQLYFRRTGHEMKQLARRLPLDAAIREFLVRPHDHAIRQTIVHAIMIFLHTYQPTVDDLQRLSSLHDGSQSISQLTYLMSTSPQQDGRSHYERQLFELFAAGDQGSLVVDILHIYQYNRELCQLVLEAPATTLPLFQEAVFHFVANVQPTFLLINPTLACRIYIPSIPASEADDSLLELMVEKDWPSLKSNLINKYVRLQGVVSARSVRLHRIAIVELKCTECSTLMGPFDLASKVDITSKEIRSSNTKVAFLPQRCINPACRSSKLVINPARTTYDDYQTLTLQEPPSSLAAGRLPDRKEVVVTGDLIDQVKPGDSVVVCGVYRNRYDPRMNRKAGFPVFSTLIEANFLKGTGDVGFDFSPDDQNELLRMSQLDGNQLDDLLLRAIAPSIHGMQLVKQCLLLALVGGVSYRADATKRTRGDLHLLMIGDPGVSKSQLLKYAQSISPKCIYSSGKGSSAAGLTVAVKRSATTGDFQLHAGALVLANQGVCIVDEIDKMNEVDRTALHQAMEQQTVSVAKAGIIATLEARAGVIAAANPISGQYISALPVTSNINIGDALLSRFDLVCVVKDVVDQTNDLSLATFIIEQHCRAHPHIAELIDLLEHLQSSMNAYRQERLAPSGVEFAEENQEKQQLAQLNERFEGHISELAEILGHDHVCSVLGSGFIANSNSPDYLPNSMSVRHVVDSVLHSPSGNVILPQSFLRKYIHYARGLTPALTEPCKNVIKGFYERLRQLHTAGCTAITNRQIGTLFRIATAHAKLRLLNEVGTASANYAVRLFVALYIPQQKLAVQHRVRGELARMGERAADRYAAAMAILSDCIRSTDIYRRAVGEEGGPVTISMTHFASECVLHGIELTQDFFSSEMFLRLYDVVRNEGGVITTILRRGEVLAG